MRLLVRRRPPPRYMDRAQSFLAPAARASRRLGHGWIGTEHLLLGLTEDRASSSARALAELHLSPDQIEADIRSLVGIGERPQRSLDADALATLGIDLEQVRGQIEQTFGPGALERTQGWCTPIAPRLKKALELAAREAGDSPLRSRHVLLALASVEDSLAARILTSHRITVDDLRASLAQQPPEQPT